MSNSEPTVGVTEETIRKNKIDAENILTWKPGNLDPLETAHLRRFARAYLDLLSEVERLRAESDAYAKAVDRGVVMLNDLRSEVATLRAERERYRKALREFGSHKADCAWQLDGCSCGFTAARR